MYCCQCQGIEELFNEQSVAKEQKRYHKKGPDKTTRMLIDALKKKNLHTQSLLDIGGGVGMIQHALLAAGVQTAVDVDASMAYLNGAQAEARRLGISEQISFLHGNFIELAGMIQPADIVTLDRVICCFPDMEQMVGLSAERAKEQYGLVYPRDSWWVKIAIRLLNLVFWIQKSPFRTYVHSSRAVDNLVRSRGLKRQYHRSTFVWQVVVYTRS